MCIDFSRQHVTRTTAVSAIAYIDTGHWPTSHHFSHWQIELIVCQMTNCIVFFPKHEQEKQSG